MSHVEGLQQNMLPVYLGYTICKFGRSKECLVQHIFYLFWFVPLSSAM